jgi:cell wall-associated NlpC family hydrolase
VAKARRLLDLPATRAVAACPKKKLVPKPLTSAEWIPVPLDESPTPTDSNDVSTDTYVGVLPEKGEIQPPTVPLEPAVESGTKIRLEGRLAIAPAGVPSVIQTAIDAGNRLQDKFYKWGGGRARLEDNGYDCSGSVSYVLIKAGLLRSPLTSGSFMRYGEPGPGRWITIYARNGHVFMTLCGLRLDTGGHAGRGESGPRWCPNSRGIRGFVMRHPPGF